MRHRVKKENVEFILKLLQEAGIQAEECQPRPLHQDPDDAPLMGDFPMTGVECPLSGTQFHKFLVTNGIVAPWSHHDKNYKSGDWKGSLLPY